MKQLLLLFLCVTLSTVSFGQSVGIGTTTPNPLYKLDVNGPITSQGIRLFGPTNTLTFHDQVRQNRFYQLWANSGYTYLKFQPHANAAIVIDSTNKIAFGGSNPTTWFDVSYPASNQLARFNGSSSTWITIAENNVNRGYIGSVVGNPEDVDFGTYSSNPTGKLHLTTANIVRLSVNVEGNIGIGELPVTGYRLSTLGGDVRMTNTASAMNLVLKSNSFRSLDFMDENNVVEASVKSSGPNLYMGRASVFTDLTIDAEGDVGIGGEILPVSKLQVVGGADASYLLNGYIMTGTVGGSNLVIDNNELLARTNGGPNDMHIQNDGGNLLLCGLEAGNVGIGVQSAGGLAEGFMLSVDGKIACEEVRVFLSEDWPDYVFKPEYDLPAIEDIDSYINTHGHLPGIPTAEEIATDGLTLGDMQKRMMEKIEELTLYIIDLHKEIDTLKQMIDK